MRRVDGLPMFSSLLWWTQVLHIPFCLSPCSLWSDAIADLGVHSSLVLMLYIYFMPLCAWTGILRGDIIHLCARVVSNHFYFQRCQCFAVIKCWLKCCVIYLIMIHRQPNGGKQQPKVKPNFYQRLYSFFIDRGKKRGKEMGRTDSNVMFEHNVYNLLFVWNLIFFCCLLQKTKQNNFPYLYCLPAFLITHLCTFCCLVAFMSLCLPFSITFSTHRSSR